MLRIPAEHGVLASSHGRRRQAQWFIEDDKQLDVNELQLLDARMKRLNRRNVTTPV